MDVTTNFQMKKPSMADQNQTIDDAVNAIGYNAAICDNLLESIVPYFQNSANRSLLFGNGTGDGASFSIYNAYISSWDGLTFGSHSNYNSPNDFSFKPNVLIDCRTGDMTTKGKYLYDNGDQVVRGRFGITDLNLINGGEYIQVNTKNNGTFGINIWTSDISLKENIEDSTENALSKINQIEHKEFDWKKDGKHQELGVISQNLEKINNQWVVNVLQEDGSVHKQPNEATIIPYLTKAIQELDEKIEKLKNIKQGYDVKDVIKDNKCIIKLNENFINTKYEVFVSPYGNGNVWVDTSEMYSDYFVVHGTADIPFVCNIKQSDVLE